MTDKRVPRERKHDDAPERIYLQVCDDADCKIPFDEHYEVTWARESITERSIEYVRADVACAERDALKAALRELIDTARIYPAFVGERFPAALERARALLAAPEDAPK